MPRPSNIDYLHPFIGATITAAARFRRVLIVIIVASTLAFGAFWNARSGSWFDSRIKVAHDAEVYFTLKEYEEKLIDNTEAIAGLTYDLKFTNLTQEFRNKKTEEILSIRVGNYQVRF